MTLSVSIAEDGSLAYKGKHVVLTGPIQGTVTLTDGSVVNVSAPVVEADSPEHAGEIAHHIGVRYEAEHPSHDEAHPFRHLCTDACGPAGRPADHPAQVAAVAQAKAQVKAIPDDEHRAEVASALGVDLSKKG